jgi:hypothetical protein
MWLSEWASSRSEWVAAAAELLRLGLLLAPDGRSLQEFDTSSADLTEEEAPPAAQILQLSQPNQQSSQAKSAKSTSDRSAKPVAGPASTTVPQRLSGLVFRRCAHLEFSHLENSLKYFKQP